MPRWQPALLGLLDLIDGRRHGRGWLWLGGSPMLHAHVCLRRRSLPPGLLKLLKRPRLGVSLLGSLGSSIVLLLLLLLLWWWWWWWWLLLLLQRLLLFLHSLLLLQIALCKTLLRLLGMYLVMYRRRGARWA